MLSFFLPQAILKCMSVQFDVVAKDRQLILYKLSQLQNAMPQRSVFSWSFFLSRLQQLFVEAELSENSEAGSSRGIFNIGECETC